MINHIEQIEKWKFQAQEYQNRRQLLEAEKAYLHALTLKPTLQEVGLLNFKKIMVELSEVYAALGHLYEEQGRSNEAISVFSQALKCQHEKSQFQIDFAHSVRWAQFTEEDENIKSNLMVCLKSYNVNHQNLAIPGISLIKLKNEFFEIMNALDNELEFISKLNTQRIQDFLLSPLWLLLLKKAILADPDIEKMVVSFRHFFMCLCVKETLFPQLIPFLYGLSRQIYMTEYVHVILPEERKGIENLITIIETGKDCPSELIKQSLIVLSCFVPLSSLKQLSTNLLFEQGQIDPDFQDLLHFQIIEKEIERSYLNRIPCLSPIKNQISKAMQFQYENNPYPQWFSLNRYKPIELQAYIQELSPFTTLSEISFSHNPKLLIAGSGTGRQAIEGGLRFQNTNILALDLSLNSLAYSMRMAENYKLSNIQFLQGDILDLKRVGFKFDLIECTGVLHHMENPLEGWKILRSLLKSKGWMLIGLYSELGRQDVTEARKLMGQMGYHPTIEDIRACRRKIQDLAKTQPLLKQVSESLDFYTTSCCRDLLFNTYEKYFSLAQIKQMLQELQLEFMGFILPQTNYKLQYLNAFPKDPAMKSLDNWILFEKQHPDTFIGMYQFLVKSFQ